MLLYIKRFYLSLIALAFVLLLFGTVTYAWISMASVNSLDGMSITTATGNELLISLDGINYSRELSTDSLDQLIKDVKLTDVTSLDGIHFSRGGYHTDETVIANNHYVSFEIWLQTDRNEHEIYLIENVSSLITFDTTSSGTYVVSQGVTWKPSFNFINGPSVTDIVEKNQVDTYYGSEAIRISFQEIIDEENLLDTRTFEDLRTLIYDPSENPERGYGVSFGAYSYFLMCSQVPLATPTELQDAKYHLTTFDPDNPYRALDDESLIATLQPSDAISNHGKTLYRGKVIVNIWIEGWDADAFNSILSDRIKIQLKFKAAKSSSLYE